jgi:hypothetical protein
MDLSIAVREIPTSPTDAVGQPSSRSRGGE